MSDNKLEELRYDAAHLLLSKMSKGSQFQYALDRMMDLMRLHTEEQLKEIMSEKKPKNKSRQKQGF